MVGSTLYLCLYQCLILLDAVLSVIVMWIKPLSTSCRSVRYAAVFEVHPELLVNAELCALLAVLKDSALKIDCC